MQSNFRFANLQNEADVHALTTLANSKRSRGAYNRGAEEWTPVLNGDKLGYVLAYLSHVVEPIAFAVVSQTDSLTCYKIDFTFAWGDTAEVTEVGADFLDWFRLVYPWCRDLVGYIPADNRAALMFALRMGFAKVGVLPLYPGNIVITHRRFENV